VIAEIRCSIYIADESGAILWEFDPSSTLGGESSSSWVEPTLYEEVTERFLAPSIPSGEYRIVVEAEDLLSGQSDVVEKPIAISAAESEEEFRPSPIGVEEARAAFTKFLAHAQSLGWEVCLSFEGYGWDAGELGARMWESSALLLRAVSNSVQVVGVALTVHESEEIAAREFQMMMWASDEARELEALARRR